MTPESLSIYSVVTTPTGIRAVLRAVEHLFESAYVKRSGYDGTESLRLQSGPTEFYTEPLDERGDHLFNGSMDGSLDDAVAFVGALSAALQAASISHQFEIYNERNELLRLIPETVPTHQGA